MGTNDHDSVDVLSWKEEMVNTGCVDTAVKGLGEGRAIEGENIVYIKVKPFQVCRLWMGAELFMFSFFRITVDGGR
jgi:hypothetical protein